MPRQKSSPSQSQDLLEDRAFLEASLEGLRLQRERIDVQISEVEGRLGRRKRGRPRKLASVPAPTNTKKRTISAAARKRMALAQKKRRAKEKKAGRAKQTSSE